VLCVDLVSGPRKRDRALALGEMGLEMDLCLRDFRRRSFTPTQAASSVATAPLRSVRTESGAVVDADAAGSRAEMAGRREIPGTRIGEV
jgi:hypothetical protein